MSQEERDDLYRLKRAKDGAIGQREAGQRTGVSEHWVRKLLKRMKRDGCRVVVHRLRGRASNRKLPDGKQARAISCLKQPGRHDFGPTFASETRVPGRVFHELRLIEHWGGGIQRMNTACEDAGLPRPKLEELGTHFRVTIFNRRVAAARVDRIDENILSALSKGGAKGTGAIAKQVGLSARTKLTRLSDLKARGIVVELGTGPHDPKRQYLLADMGS